MIVNGNHVGNNDSNLFLRSEAVIYMDGALDEASRIGVDGDNLPRLITYGWSRYMAGMDPADFFSHDDGCSRVVLDGSEVFCMLAFVQRSWNGSCVESATAWVPNEAYVIVYNGQGTLNNAWVVVNGNQTYDWRIEIKGSVKLILMDGAKLEATEGVHVGKGNTLTIYGQANDSGTLVATGTTSGFSRLYNSAGIGSNSEDLDETDAGTINICGGTIKAEGSANGAAIGGGQKSGGGTINIYGSSITATGGSGGAAIGCGFKEGLVGNSAGPSKADISIYGGNITANGGKWAAGIGGGVQGYGNVGIYGGTVNATGGVSAAGIGGGEYASAGRVVIAGCTVTAKSVEGPGIGCGLSTAGTIGEIIITGGTVTATGSRGYAGIGSGTGSNVKDLTIEIAGGSVTATGGGSYDSYFLGGAGIGTGGFLSTSGGDYDGTIQISGGTVIATSTATGDEGGAGIGAGCKGDMGGTIEITVGIVHVTGKGGGAAIGAGSETEDSSYGGECTGTVKITGGTVYLKSASRGVYIGHGLDGDDDGKLTLGDELSVCYADSEPVSAANRESTCRNDDSRELQISICSHSGGLTYTVTEESHTAHCEYCKVEHLSEAHRFNDYTHECVVCGYIDQNPLFKILFMPGEGEGTAEDMPGDEVVPNTEYEISECNFAAPAGKLFREWSVIMGDYAAYHDAGDIITVTDNVILTAEFEPLVTIRGVTGSFNDKIKLNFYFDLPADIQSDPTAYVSFANVYTGKTLSVSVGSGGKYVESKGWKFSISLAAKEASDPIVTRIFRERYDLKGEPFDEPVAIVGGSGKDYTETGIEYSLMEYFTWLETKGSDANEKAVGAAAKDYCSAAQIYFDYNAAGVSVSSRVDAVTTDMLSNYVAGRSGTLPAGVSVRGITAMLESDNTIRIYLGFKDVSPDDFTCAIDGKKVDIQRRSDGTTFLALDEGV